MCCISWLEAYIEYIIRNAYILIAKDGTPFIESGRRASKLLSDNIDDVIALNTFGDVVLVVCRFLIVLIAGFVGYAVLIKDDSLKSTYGWPLALGITSSLLIAHCFVMVFEMTVDSIFISFCVDLEEHDGITSQYYMTDGLKKVLMEMKSGNFKIGGNDLKEHPSNVLNDPQVPEPMKMNPIGFVALAP